MHLADSAFPIGATSHSFGLETLVADGVLRAAEVESFLSTLLWENGLTEAFFLRYAYRLAHQPLSRSEAVEASITAPDGAPTPAVTALLPQWLTLNRYVAAMKGARESRNASATLGRRFLQTVAGLEEVPLFQAIYQQTMDHAVEIHYCAAFGFVGGALGLGETETVLAYLQQSIMGLVSACVRLLALGQSRAGAIVWRLKTVVVAVTEASADMVTAVPAGLSSPDWQECLQQLSLFTPMVDLGSMRHPRLHTRLFVS